MNNHERLIDLLNANGFKYEYVDKDGDVMKVWSDSPALLVPDTITKVMVMESGYGVEWNESLLGVENATSVILILSAYFEEEGSFIKFEKDGGFEDINPSHSNFFNWFGYDRPKEENENLAPEPKIRVTYLE